MREDYQKPLKTLTLYFLSNPSDQVGAIQSSFRVLPNIAPANLCKPIHEIINYSTSIWPFESGKCGKEKDKLQKFEYLENERAITWLKNNKLIKNSRHKL